jgi:hypothetical protein
MEEKSIMGTPEFTPASPEPKKSNTGIIIAVVVVVLLCCCCISGIGGWYLWVNGDQLINSGTSLLINIL